VGIEPAVLDADGAAMTIRNAFGEGARSLRRAPRVCWIFYAATTAPALIVAAVLLAIAQTGLGNSAWTHALGANLDASWISEMTAQYGGMLVAPLPALMMGGLGIFAVVYILLLGGALEALCAGGRFWAGCGAHFWRLVRLAVFAAICAVPVMILNALLNKVGEKAWGEGSAEAPLIYWAWFRHAVLYGLLGLVNLAFEYGAIRLVMEDSRKAWRALMAAFRLIARHPGKTIGLYLLLSIVLLLVVVTGFAVSRLVPQTTVAAVLLLFLFQQAAVLSKIWIWLLFFPAQAAMWESIREVAPPPAAVEPEPVPEVPAFEQAAAPMEPLPPGS
jgi:hypothetical protein